MDLLRRETLASMAAMAGAMVVGNGNAFAADGSSGLHAAAKAKDIRFGSAIAAGSARSGSFRNPDYVKIMQADCGIVVAENEMKWQSLRPNAADYNFAPFDSIADFAQKMVWPFAATH